MRNIISNLNLIQCKYVFQTNSNSILKFSVKYFSDSALNFQTTCLRNSLRNTQPCFRRCVSFSRCLSQATNLSPEKKDNTSTIIYNGSLTYQVKGVKVFTCISSLGGVIIQPWLLQNILSGNNMPLGVALFSCVGFFTFITPFLIHLLTKKYVTEIWYNPTTDTYTATVLSFFLQRIPIEFKIEDVKIPGSLPIFSTMYIKGRPVFVISDSFLDIEHYIKMVGYDKPLSMDSESSDKS